MPRPTYPLETRAAAIELLHAGNTLATVSQHYGCTIATVSKWYMDYLGYRGREGITVTMTSERWDMVEFDHK